MRAVLVGTFGMRQYMISSVKLALIEAPLSVVSHKLFFALIVGLSFTACAGTTVCSTAIEGLPHAPVLALDLTQELCCKIYISGAWASCQTSCRCGEEVVRRVRVCLEGQWHGSVAGLG